MITYYGELMPHNYYIARWIGVDGEAAGDARIAEQLYKWWGVIFLAACLARFVTGIYKKERDRNL
jgi:hypothetical protein